MKNTIFIILILFSIFNSFSQIIEVKQDGTGDHASIQSAIDAAQTGDTVLVWPGAYFENLEINAQGITLGSLLLTTGEEGYKYNTVIDGSNLSSCINIPESLDTISIIGFTIQHGNATYDYYYFGGGLRTRSSILLEKCVIKNNQSRGGGGIVVLGDNTFARVKGCTIFNNYSLGAGGGCALGHGSSIYFDTVNKNSIYNNYANKGCDFHKASETISPLVIKLDTGSVISPDTYFFSSQDNSGYQINDLEINISHSVIAPYDGDLFVNPVNGDNNNSGTSTDEALLSIAMAYHKIHVDSLEKNTIHLSNGIYSDSTNNERFPLNIRPFINVVGESRDGVILDGNRNIYILQGNNKITDYSFKNMTLQGGRKPDYGSWEIYPMLADLYYYNHRFVLENIVFRDSYAKTSFGVLLYSWSDSSMVKNCKFNGNNGGFGLRSFCGLNQTQFINNTVFENHQPDFEAEWPYSPGGWSLGIGFEGTSIIQNCLFNDNPFYAFTRNTKGGSTYLVNCTFDNNSEMEDSPAIGVYDADINMYNCIATNNHQTAFEISIGEYQQEIHSHLNIYNSLIEGGEDGIEYGFCQHSDTNWCHVHYDPTNIDADPNFLGMWGDPYMIADGSPCIDAGTLANLPDFIEIPEFDLAGNPRIVGDSIDMGAYEWNPTIVGFNEIGSGNREEKPKLLKASPNPFDWGTYLSVEVENENEVSSYARASVDKKVEVYDNYGRLVRNILNTTLPEKQEILWYGDDNNGNPLPAGVYHVVMFSGEREVESLKVIKK